MKNFQKYTIALISILVFIVFTFEIKACGWSENWESYRMALFRAQMSKMSVFSPFFYSSQHLNSYVPDPEYFDRRLNNQEWQKELGQEVLYQDIQVILYKTNPDLILLAYRENKLQEVFAGNSFIYKLLLSKNKEMLEYLIYAKQNEFANFSFSDPWSDEPFDITMPGILEAGLISKAEQKLTDKTLSVFLKQRYAFQLIRLLKQTGNYKQSILLYDQNFTDQDETIIKYWALLHKALSLDNLGQSVEANLLYAIVFDKSDEKKLRSYQCFNTDPTYIKQNLLKAKNNNEKAAIYALLAFKNPGRCMDKIENIFSLNTQSAFLAPLIMREINKLEDWLITPFLTNNGPSVYENNSYYERNNYQKNKEENIKRDTEYLRKFRDFLAKCYSTSNGEWKDYLASAIAHLYFIDDDALNGQKYLDYISSQAPEGIKLQKLIDELVVKIYTSDINSEPIKEQIFNHLVQLEKIAKTNNFVYKILYTAVKKLSNRFELKQQFHIAGLLAYLAQKHKGKYVYSESEYDYFPYLNYYGSISYFDLNSDFESMEKLIELVHKKEKTNFETLLCNQSTTDLNAYFDMAGTIAFRNNDLTKALKLFSKLPSDYWKTTYEFAQYLNENPFVPKIWPHERDFSYSFNKADFIKKLIRLKDEAEKKPEKRAENYLKLGHAYYNCTYFGNSWMMSSYGWSSIPDESNYDFYYTFQLGSIFPMKANFKKMYFECALAIEYYKKVLISTSDSEIEAAASYMLYCCDLNNHLYKHMYDENLWKGTHKYIPGLPLKDLYTNYRNTKTFENVRCSWMDDFAAKWK